jgi:hypothetical protein
MSHIFGREFDELVARARLGSAYDNQLSDIAEERLAFPGGKSRRRVKTTNSVVESEAQILEGAIFLEKHKR